jgi:hypothetical protein
MATSGSTVFNPSIVEMLQEAYERAGLEMRSGYDVTTGRRSFNLLMVEFANMQLNMWSEESVSLSLVQGTTSYALAADTVDVIEGTIRLNAGNTTTQSDLVISRTSMYDYIAVPNKLVQGQPTQYAVERGTDTPTVYFYPTPDGAQSYTFFYRRLRRLQNAGTTGAVTADTSFRFYDAVIAGLAYRIASKRREAMALVPQLKAAYDEALLLAQDEDRDRASLMLVPYANQRY